MGKSNPDGRCLSSLFASIQTKIQPVLQQSNQLFQISSLLLLPSFAVVFYLSVCCCVVLWAALTRVLLIQLVSSRMKKGDYSRLNYGMCVKQVRGKKKTFHALFLCLKYLNNIRGFSAYICYYCLFVNLHFVTY